MALSAQLDSVKLTMYLLSEAGDLTGVFESHNRPFALSSSLQKNTADLTARHWTSGLPFLSGLALKGQILPMPKRQSAPSCLDSVNPDSRNFVTPCTNASASPAKSKVSSRGKITHCSRFVTDACVLSELSRQLIKYAGDLAACSERETLLLDLLWLLVSGNQHVESVLFYLSQEEMGESDVWLRDDLRISWLTCLYAFRGYAQPHVAATYQVLGLHPNQVFEAMTEKRKSLLSQEFAACSASLQIVNEQAAMGGSVSGKLPPKKLPESVLAKKAGVA